MFALLRPALVLFVGLALLTGLAYPLTVLGIGQVLFPAQANGSLVVDEGRVVGSALIGQGFGEARYFHPRPSAAGAGYDATASSGSNLGPTSAALVERTATAVATAQQDGVTSAVPADLVTASGSGLDPHISPAAALVQIDRIAAARGLPRDRLIALVDRMTEGRELGFFGEPRVNVLELNRQLDRLG